MENSTEFTKFQLDMIQRALDSNDYDIHHTISIIRGICMLSDRPLTQAEKDYAKELEINIGKAT